MPYIPDKDRPALHEKITALANEIIKIHKEYGYDGAFLGLVNYSVTTLVSQILLKAFDRLRYWHSPAVRGTMQDIGDELYRRVFVQYEDVQIEKNGDVPEYQQLKNGIK